MRQELEKQLGKPHIQLAVLFGTLALALISNHLFRDAGSPLDLLYVLFGMLVVVELVWFVAKEVKDGAKKYGWKHEVLDTVIALAVAVGIWYGASFILNTSAPISAVVSCSMLPELHRGDFVIVQGAPAAAYDIEMSGPEFSSIGEPSLITYDGNSATVPGSLYSYCVMDSGSDLCRLFISHPELFIERKGPLTYRYERCRITFSNGTEASMPCLKSVGFKGDEYLTRFSNDIIVYAPQPGEPYSAIGDIVHRAMFRITVDGSAYYLTRGDNNPLLDIQIYDYRTGRANLPVPEENVRGKVIARIPLLGYFKLFISGFFTEDEQCRTQLSYTHA